VDGKHQKTRMSRYLAVRRIAWLDLFDESTIPDPAALWERFLLHCRYLRGMLLLQSRYFCMVLLLKARFQLCYLLLMIPLKLRYARLKTLDLLLVLFGRSA
jgi:hypothetical protein